MKRSLVVAGVVVAAAAVAWLAALSGPSVPSREPLRAAAVGSPLGRAEPPEDARAVAQPPAPAADAARDADAPADEPAEAPPATDVATVPMPPSGVEVTVVVDTTGMPLAGVSVGIVPMGEDLPPALLEALKRRDDPFTIARDHGRVLTTDEAGRVVVPAPDAHALVAARSGEMVGTLWVHAGMTTARLVLHRPGQVTVIVEDASGTPCPDVKVLLVEDSKYGRSPRAWMTTGPDGSATFPDVAAGPRDHADAVRGVTVALAFAPPPYVRIDPRAPPPAPVRLVLPPSGSVHCHVVDESGRSVTDVESVLLRVPRDGTHEYFVQDEPGKFDDARATPAAGTAVFPHVGIGLDLEVEVASAAGTRTTVTQRLRGPSRAGEVTQVDVTVGAARPVVVGRLVDAKGGAIADLQLFADVVEPGNETLDMGDCDMSCTSVTDAAGRFRFALDRRPGATPSARLHLGRAFHGKGGSWGVRGIALIALPGTLPSGETDVGDVVYRGTEILVAGVVVEPDGRPLQGVWVRAMEPRRVSVPAVSHGPMVRLASGRSPDDTVDVVRTDAEGRFRLTGARLESTVELGVEADGWFVAEEASFDVGATDARIEMHRAGGVAGSIHVAEGMDPTDVRVLIQGDPQRNGDMDYRFGDDGLWALVRADGTFEVRTLRPGTARVVVRRGWGPGAEIARIDGVVITAGEITRDPRLQAIDPASGRSKVTVSVVDREGRPVYGAQVHHRPAGSDELWGDVTTGSAGTGGAPVLRLPAVLVVTRKGYRHGSATTARSDLTVVLEEAPQSVVRVRLSEDVPLLTPPHGLSVTLRWLGDAAADDPLDWGHPLDVDDSSSRFGEERVISLGACDAGRYRVELMLWSTLPGGGAGGSSFPTVPEVVVVTVPDGGATVEVAVAVDTEVLRRRTSGGDR